MCKNLCKDCSGSCQIPEEMSGTAEELMEQEFNEECMTEEELARLADDMCTAISGRK